MSVELEYVELARVDRSGLITKQSSDDNINSIKKIGRDEIIVSRDEGTFIYPMHRVMKMKVKE